MNFPLRYTSESCEDLAPEYVDEDFDLEHLLGGHDGHDHGEDEAKEGEDEGGVTFETPKKSTTRNPPFRIVTDFSEYRLNREYTGEDEELAFDRY